MPFNAPHPGQKQEGGSGLQSLVKAEKLLQIALVMPVAVFIGWIAGVGLDRWLHRSWIYIPGLILGCIAGLVEAVRQAVSSDKALDRPSDEAP
ncbi:MAG TPA: AtpZ/AtpI family protein [Acidisarcina sp.]